MTEEIPSSIKTLSQLRAAEAECTRCPLYRDATQLVPGEGPAHARLMLVGEQPGDKEDIAGKPFVGPAGRMLDQARSPMPAFRATRPSSPTRSSTSSTRCAGSAACTSGRTPTRSSAASGGTMSSA